MPTKLRNWAGPFHFDFDGSGWMNFGYGWKTYLRQEVSARTCEGVKRSERARCRFCFVLTALLNTLGGSDQRLLKEVFAGQPHDMTQCKECGSVEMSCFRILYIIISRGWPAKTFPKCQSLGGNLCRSRVTSTYSQFQELDAECLVENGVKLHLLQHTLVSLFVLESVYFQHREDGFFQGENTLENWWRPMDWWLWVQAARIYQVVTAMP